MTVLCPGPRVLVMLNGQRINNIPWTRITSVNKNPGGSQ